MDFSKSFDLPRRKEANTADLEWQIDSECIGLSSPGITTSFGNKKDNNLKTVSNDNPRFNFTSTNKGGRILIVDHQALHLCKKTVPGFSLWVCTIPSCNAQCILDPDENMIIRYSGDHNHEPGVNRVMYKNFINILKNAVKENPHVKPKVLFQKEFKRIKDEWEEGCKVGKNMNADLTLPSFDEVRMAMIKTRNAILSTFSLRPTEESRSEGKPSVGPSRSTRSRDGSAEGKRKVTSSKNLDNADLDELEDAWTAQAHKDASLSDFEDLLEEDIITNISTKVTATKAKDNILDSTDLNPIDFAHENEGDIWNTTIPLEKIPRRKYRKRPASLSVFTCTHCPYKSNRHFNVQRHERLAHSSKKPEFNCKECGTSYSLEYRLKLHIKAVHQGEGHHCHICSRTFETMTGLKSHLVTKHKNEESKVQRELPPELTCKLCCRVFTTKAHLLKHTNTHVMVQPYRCYACNQPFLDECTWLTHQNNCNEAFTIQCCLCSRVIPNAQELLTHMDDVHGRAEYSCNCGKAFPWKKSLLTHQQKCSLYMAEKAPIL